jgi:hypothetical protein
MGIAIQENVEPWMQTVENKLAGEANLDVVNSFRDSLGRLTQLGREEGLELQPYIQTRLSHFRELPSATAEGIASALKEYCETMQTIRNNGEYLRFNLNAVWLTLRKLGLRPRNDLFSKLNDKDVVEIYNAKGLQIFRSFHFFQHCSYDLETIFCKPWFELFARDEVYSTAYMEGFNNLVNGTIKETVPVPVDEHLVREVQGRLTTRIMPNVFSPLADGYLIHAFRVLRVEH